MSSKNETLLHRWFERVWNKADESGIDQLLRTDVVIHGIELPAGKTGAAGFKDFYKNFREQFPDAKVDVEHVVIDGDMQAALTHVTATDKASGKPVRFSGQCLIRTSDGKIAEAWNHYDFMSMYQQLGHQMVAS